MIEGRGVGGGGGDKNQNPKKSLGLQTKPKKLPGPKYPMPNFRAIKIYSRNYAAGIRGNYQESSDCFEYPKKHPYLNQATPKNTCQKFPTPKNPEIENFKPKKNPSIIPVTWDPKTPPPPPPGLESVYNIMIQK